MWLVITLFAVIFVSGLAIGASLEHGLWELRIKDRLDSIDAALSEAATADRSNVVVGPWKPVVVEGLRVARSLDEITGSRGCVRLIPRAEPLGKAA